MLRIAAKEEDSEHWGALKHPPQALTPTRALAQARPSRDDRQGECSVRCLQTAVWSKCLILL